MAGHVFITRGDLRKIHCDAWLLPCDIVGNVEQGWLDGGSEHLLSRVERLRRDDFVLPPGWGHDGRRVITFDDWPSDSKHKLPWPVAVNVGGWPGLESPWYVEGAHQFCRTVAERFQGKKPRTKRSRPLAALPLVGTGRGMAGEIRGDVVRDLVDRLHIDADRYDLDIVLVTDTAAKLAAAQNRRRRSKYVRADGSAINPWSDLPPAHRERARELAEDARYGRLVLFIGAGVSASAGLPNWKCLLSYLADQAGLDADEIKMLEHFDVLDRARIVEGRLEQQGQKLGAVVADHLAQVDHYSLAHGLLASLPVSDVITMNYDRLFELASEAVGRPVVTLPYQSVVRASRWLLKMHGCVDHPDDIVLTREDYLRYTERRAALFGIVQALLITRHMLFLGFSLTDDNFHRIVDDVRKAVREGDAGEAGASTRFGTALLLRRNPLLEELWKKDLYCVPMSESAGNPTAADERLVEIFLDYLLGLATDGSSPILDATFDGALTDDEIKVGKALRCLEEKTCEEVRASPAWRPVADLLARLRDAGRD